MTTEKNQQFRFFLLAIIFLSIGVTSCKKEKLNGNMATGQNATLLVTSGSNLALRTGVIATCSGSTGTSENADKARDGNTTTTKWCDNVATRDKWIAYDLGAACDINSFVLNWEDWDKNSKYKIQKSSDGNTWTDVIVETANTSDPKSYTVSLMAVRFVRFWVAQADDDCVRLMEFEVWGVVSSSVSTNIALNTSVIATCSGSTGTSENADKARDGNTTTTKWCDNVAHDKWIKYDLGASYDITKFVLNWEDWDKNSKYKIQKSSDGNTWTDVIVETANTSDPREYAVSLSAVRYVRFWVAQADDDCVRLMEFEVWSGTTPPPVNWVMTFSDEFNGASGSAPDPAKWTLPNFQRRPGGAWDPANAYMDGIGNLVIRCRKIGTDQYSSACVMSGSDPNNVANTQNAKFSQTYGKFECRAKLPAQQGWWVAWWMMCGNQGSIGNGAIDGAEIDIMEGWGWTDKLNHAVIWDGYGANKGSSSYQSNQTGIRNGYHIYTLIWDPAYYSFQIDGTEVFRTSQGGICNQPGFVQVSGEISTESWAIADTWAKNPAGATYPDYFYIDWIHVYKAQ